MNILHEKWAILFTFYSHLSTLSEREVISIPSTPNFYPSFYEYPAETNSNEIFSNKYFNLYSTLILNGKLNLLRDWIYSFFPEELFKLKWNLKKGRLWDIGIAKATILIMASEENFINDDIFMWRNFFTYTHIHIWLI